MTSRRNGNRPANLRAVIADEAARIMIDGGLADFRAAKAKAVERLGLGSHAPLPGNAEIEAALAQRNRIFRGDAHAGQLRELRRTAAAIMRRLEDFHPRLVGAVLSGAATEHAVIELHLFADAPESVGERLAMVGLRYRLAGSRQRWRRGQSQQLPGFRFQASGSECLATVFPERQRAHAPLSPVDGRPMRRADLKQLRALIAAAAPFSDR